MNYGNEMCLSIVEVERKIALYIHVGYVLYKRLFGLYGLFVIRARLDGGEFKAVIWANNSVVWLYEDYKSCSPERASI